MWDLMLQMFNTKCLYHNVHLSLVLLLFLLIVFSSRLVFLPCSGDTRDKGNSTFLLKCTSVNQRLLCLLYFALLYPSVRRYWTHEGCTQACLAWDETIGQGSQGYQKWGHAAPESWVLKIGSQWDFCVI